MVLALENYGLIFTFFPLSESCSWVLFVLSTVGDDCVARMHQSTKGSNCFHYAFRAYFESIAIYQQNKAVLSSFIWLKKQKTLVWLLHIFNPFWKLIVRAKLWGKADDFSYCFINTFCEFYNFTQFWYQRRD